MTDTILYGTYLINLDRAKQRLELMEQEFKKQDMPFQKISAVDAEKLDKYEFKIKNRYDRKLVPGEIGCYLSHIQALKTFLESGNSYALIIEDDAVLCDDFKTILEKSLLAYKDLPEKHKWDVLKLFNGKRRHIKITDIYKNYFLAACGTSVPITTIAAVWTRKAAEKFLNKVANPVSVIGRPIDCDLQHPWEFNLRIYNILPSLVSIAPFETQIQLVKKLRKSNVRRQIVYEINRFFSKYFYLISHHGIKDFYNSFIAKKNAKIS